MGKETPMMRTLLTLAGGVGLGLLSRLVWDDAKRRRQQRALSIEIDQLAKEWLQAYDHEKGQAR